MRYNSGNIVQPFRKNVSCMFIIYWVVLVFWQNVGGAEVRSSVDMVIKIGLLAYFVWFYLRKAKRISKKIVWVFLLSASLLITAAREEQFPLSNVIAYAFPIIFITMVYGLGDRMEINRQHLVAFCNCVIAITLYAAIYAVIFCWDQFETVFMINIAYGNELSSFFASNFEYGMYLVAAIICCLISLKYNNDSRKKKRFYICCIVVFSINLILTFSRTALFAIIGFFLVYMLFGKGKLRRWILALMLISLVAVFVSPDLRTFLFNVVLKRNALGDRDILAVNAIEYFANGSVADILFGHGIYKSRVYFELEYGHGSVHNAYLQMLLYSGLVGFLFMLIFLLAQVYVSFRTIRRDRFIGIVSFGCVMMAMMMMMSTTAIIFTSSIDSYFLTMFFIVVPKYVRNSLYRGSFDS